VAAGTAEVKPVIVEHRPRRISHKAGKRMRDKKRRHFERKRLREKW
jgi:hypothetical protein